MVSIDSGRVFWITGLSGSGKTTLATYFYEKLKPISPQTILLDGDRMRSLYGHDLGYEEKDRRICAMRNSRFCEFLASQNCIAICATISMYDEARDWNRENITNYTEIFLDVKWETLLMRNQKGLYSNSTKKNVVGKDMEFERPKNPDYILRNENTFDLKQAANEIIASTFPAEFQQPSRSP